MKTDYAVIFDLDGTLYENKELLKKQVEVAVNILAAYNKWGYEEAYLSYVDLRNSMAGKLGYIPSTTAVIIEHDIPLRVFLKSASEAYDAELYLERDKTLHDVLLSLSKSCLLAVVSNNNKKQLSKILEKLGIYSLFSLMLSLDDTGLIKPNPDLYKIVCDRLSVNPKNCLVVGDRWDIDLAPAKTLGMEVYLVSGIRDTYRVEEVFHGYFDKGVNG